MFLRHILFENQMGLSARPLAFHVFANLILLPYAEFIICSGCQGSLFPDRRGKRIQGMGLA